MIGPGIAHQRRHPWLVFTLSKVVTGVIFAQVNLLMLFAGQLGNMKSCGLFALLALHDIIGDTRRRNYVDWTCFS